jgi:hypothetical protein
MGKPHFHLHLKGFNYTAGIVAFAALKSGLKVAIELPDSLNKNYQYELISSYPSTFYKLPGALRHYQFILKCSSFFPHLFYPLRVLNFQGSIPQKTYTVFDKFIGRDRESNFLPFSTKNTQSYRHIDELFPRGALIYAHRFDRNRAITELYSYCMNAGAVKITSNQNVGSDCTYTCEPFKYDKNIVQDKQKWPYPNAIQIESDKFLLTVFGGFHKIICIQVDIKKEIENKNGITAEIIVLLKKLQIEISDKIENGIEGIVKSTQENGASPHIVSDVSFYVLQEYVFRLLKEIKRDTGENVKLKHAFACFKQFEMSHDMFRKIDDECNAKFDLAKQTGIDYSTFSRFFYRYRHQIEQMTETAYALMNTTRDPDAIWYEAERLICDQQ